ncbi:MAG: UDP-N-acetylmuramoyl-L-alanyl-D-glutamate--2,6-diaminopimelate ligase [Desulfovibrio sp.]|nr:UDP-N-acetylmuramoyl-L-alanyl-D-glutamate--2,6-diaminopimelate ligase [Desulfovibrio sp.]
MPTDFAGLLDICRRNCLEPRSDSRAVQPGDIFIAVPGAVEDGARFIPVAANAGAAFIVCRPDVKREILETAKTCRITYHNNPREALGKLAQARWHTDGLSLKILGITGTNGKTTISYMLEKLLISLGEKVGVIGTVAYRWPGHSENAPMTTPDPIILHSLLARMADAGVTVVVTEISSHALEQQRVCGIPFQGAIFTNLTQDHMDYHQDMESYFAAKTKLFLELPRQDKAMAVNSDDDFGCRLLDLRPSALSFGLERKQRELHLQGKILASGPWGLRLRMLCKDTAWELSSPLVGVFNAYNLLAVQALGLGLDLHPKDFSSLETFTGVCGRLERVCNPAGLNIFVDYAHTPDALVNVLKSLRGAGFSRIIAVFGCGGNRDKGKRPLMGEAVACHADVAVLTSDNPRFEDPFAIIDDVLPGLAKAREVHVEPDRRTATALALDMLTKDDAMLVAGKGHEDYQIIQGVKRHYSDQETVRELLRCI